MILHFTFQNWACQYQAFVLVILLSNALDHYKLSDIHQTILQRIVTTVVDLLPFGLMLVHPSDRFAL